MSQRHIPAQPHSQPRSQPLWRFFLLLCLSIFAFSGKAKAEDHAFEDDWMVTLGPMLHFQIGGKKEWTFAIEAAYWDNPFLGFDLGLEFGKQRIILYSEVQAGLLLTGVSTGPYINLASGNRRLGWQFTAWANYGLGVDYRWRSHPVENEHFWGLYIKGLAACDADCEANADNDNSSTRGSDEVIDIIF